MSALADMLFIPIMFLIVGICGDSALFLIIQQQRTTLIVEIDPST